MAAISIYDSADVEIDVYREKFSKECLFGFACPILNINKKQQGSWKEGDDTYHPILFEIECEDNQARKLFTRITTDLSNSCVDKNNFIYDGDVTHVIELFIKYNEFDLFLKYSCFHSSEEMESINNNMSLYSWSKQHWIGGSDFRRALFKAGSDIEYSYLKGYNKANKYTKKFDDDVEAVLGFILLICRKAKRERQLDLLKKILKVMVEDAVQGSKNMYKNWPKLKEVSFVGLKSIRNTDYYCERFFRCSISFDLEDDICDFRWPLFGEPIIKYRGYSNSYYPDRFFTVNENLDYTLFHGSGSLTVKGEYEYTGDFLHSSFNGVGELKFESGGRSLQQSAILDSADMWDGVAEARVIEVSAKVGDYLEQDSSLVRVDMGIATVPITLDFSGTVLEVNVAVDDKIIVGDTIAVLSTKVGIKIVESKGVFENDLFVE